MAGKDTPIEETNSAFATAEVEETEEATLAPVIPAGTYVEGLGRRKTSVARVRISTSPGKKVMDIIVNDKPYTEYFPMLFLQKLADAPLRKLRIFETYRMSVMTDGGGPRGQAEAIRLGLARALIKIEPEWRQRLKKAGFLTRDPREVERKKYGLHKARRAPQWSKR